MSTEDRLGMTTRSKIGVGLAALFALGAGVGATTLASAAVDPPSLVGKRVPCVDSAGFVRDLASPCSSHIDGNRKAMWYDPRFASGDNVEALVQAEVAKQLAGYKVTLPTKTAPSPWTIVHKQVVLSADDPSDGSTVTPTAVSDCSAVDKSTDKVFVVTKCYRVLLTGAPKFSPTASEVYGDNSGTNTWAPDAQVSVKYPSTVASASTQRVFYVGTDGGFTNTKSLVLDLYTGVVTG